MSSGTNVKWRAKNYSGEACAKCTCEVTWNVISHVASLNKHLFILVIACQFSCIDYRISDDISTPRSPKAADSFVSNNFFIAIEGSFIFDRICLLSKRISLVLQSNLDHISGVGDCNSNCTSNHRGDDFLIEQGVLSFFEWATYRISYGEV